MAAFRVDEDTILNQGEILDSVIGNLRPQRTDNMLVLSALRLGVDEVRTVNDFASLHSADGENKVLAIVALAITPEAQNALLKVVEDAYMLRIAIMVPQTARILPTLMSRCEVERSDAISGDEADIQAWAREVLKAALPARQKKVEVLVKKSENHVIKSHMIALVSAARETARPPQVMNQALQLLSYAEQTGASHKLLLDALCLVI